jgi:Family of unknown function (DUF5641)
VERFEYHEKPFTNTGVDFFGPFFVSVGRRTETRYGVMFTCLTIQAVHLEVANDLSSSSCIMAIRRMVSRRGTVRKMFSDNGTNLRGADRELQEAVQQLDNSQFRDELVKDLIEWHFIPPAAPHMGGAWEYVPTLVNRSKWHKNNKNLAVGDIVVIDDPGLPRNLWPIGVINNVFPGKDGVVRAVDVKMTRGVLRRHAVKVCPYVRVGDEEPTARGECDTMSDPSDDEFLGY